jgi:hypothetical protein
MRGIATAAGIGAVAFALLYLGFTFGTAVFFAAADRWGTRRETRSA